MSLAAFRFTLTPFANAPVMFTLLALLVQTRVRTPSTLLNAPPSASNRLSAVRVRVSLRRLRSRPLEEAAGQEVESPDKLAEETL